MRRTLATALGRNWQVAAPGSRGAGMGPFDPKGFMASSGIRYTPRS